MMAPKRMWTAVEPVGVPRVQEVPRAAPSSHVPLGTVASVMVPLGTVASVKVVLAGPDSSVQVSPAAVSSVHETPGTTYGTTVSVHVAPPAVGADIWNTSFTSSKLPALVVTPSDPGQSK